MYSKRAFTIVELVVVIAVIGILSAVTVVSYRSVQAQARNSDRVNDLMTWKNALELYASQNQRYPDAPGPGNYCIGDTGATSGDLAALPATNTPSATITAGSPAQTYTAHYCRDVKLGYNWSRHAEYPPMTVQLKKFIDTSKSSPVSSRVTNDKMYLGTIMVYSGLDGNGNQTPTLVTFVDGQTCPNRLTRSWGDANSSMCTITLDKSLPTNYTGESWAGVY